jgi:DNA polymerase-3 subunit delta'
VHGFADRLVRPEAEDAYRLFEDLIGQLLARFARYAAAGTTIDERTLKRDAAEDAAFQRLSERAPATIWPDLRDEISESFVRADGLNLDRKQTILGVFFAIERAAR